MGVQLLYFDGCPHWAVADELLRIALSSLGRESESIEHVLVVSDEQAEALKFIGSPTFLVDGVDPFAVGDEPLGLACRLFNTPGGMAGSPTIAQMLEVLS